MVDYDLFVGDAVAWAESYKGPPFHAFFCDPPYHLDTITKRFGKKGSAPAKFGNDGAFTRISKGFMGMEWDTDVAFYPETWKAFFKILYPGAFGLSYAGSRTYHRIACAIEDAGFIIHPLIGWTYSSGLPKPTRIDKKVENGEVWEGHRYGLGALKPAFEPIILFQKPYAGKALNFISWTGAGALNVDGCRIGYEIGGNLASNPSLRPPTYRNRGGHIIVSKEDYRTVAPHPNGRWPANFVLCHHPDCKVVGQREADGYTINRFVDGEKPFGHGAGHEYESVDVPGGLEDIWECVEECPVYQLGQQSGIVKSGGKVKGTESSCVGDSGIYGHYDRVENQPYIDSGTAARFFFQADWSYEVEEQLMDTVPFRYCSKAPRKERDAGLDEHCDHPTFKPISLNKYLATLLLPPDIYKPRRVLIPFAGVGSEGIGAVLAGWDQVVMVELLQKYADVAKQRMDWWIGRADEIGSTDPGVILKGVK